MAHKNETTTEEITIPSTLLIVHQASQRRIERLKENFESVKSELARKLKNESEELEKAKRNWEDHFDEWIIKYSS